MAAAPVSPSQSSTGQAQEMSGWKTGMTSPWSLDSDIWPSCILGLYFTIMSQHNLVPIQFESDLVPLLSTLDDLDKPLHKNEVLWA